MKNTVVCLFMVFFVASVTTEEVPYDVVLVPRDVYVGDVAELTFTTDIGRPDSPPGESIVLSGEAVSSSDELSIEQVTITRKESGSEVRVLFVPWVSGRISLPAMTLDDSIIRPPDVTIVSILDRSGITMLEPARSPLLVPGTTWIIYGSVLGVLLIVVGSWFVVVRVRSWLLMNPERRIAAKRSRLFMRALRLLGKKQKTAGVEWWYTLLSAALKRYLFLYYTGNDTGSLSLTGSEFAGLSETGVCGQQIRDLFGVIDRVRFGGSEDGVSRAGLLESAENLSRILEEHTVDAVS